MIRKEKVSISWSGGKDCALALFYIMKEEKYDVVSLHTTIDYATKKVGLHGIPEKLLEKQAQALNIPLEKIYLNKNGEARSYEEEVLYYYESLKNRNIDKIISGDIFLEDLRAYKEELAQKKEIQIELPLWGSSTNVLVQEFINLGFKTIICSADADIFPAETISKVFDTSFLANLPEGVDPCGENGEFHSFTFDGPVFKNNVAFKIKEVVSENFSFKTDEGKTFERNFLYAEFG